MTRHAFLLAILAALSALAMAQQSPSAVALPSAPGPNLNAALQATVSPDANGTSAQVQSLTRAQAEQMAIQNNPRITAAKLLALAQHEVVREARSADLPMTYGQISAVDAKDASRLSAGSLNSSRLLTHAGAGGGFTQLITDFGRTHNLVLSRKLAEESSRADALATTEDVVLAADEAFYDALTAQAVLRVAVQTIHTRQATQTQISQLTSNKLRSTLDLSFANVNLSQAKLLKLDAQNNADAAMAALDEILGLDRQVTYQLIDDDGPLPTLPSDVEEVVGRALQQRPDLQARNLDQQSAQKYARAERQQMLPSISAAGTLGAVPIRTDQYYNSNWWGAVGVNVEIPIFNGFLYSAQAKEAGYRANVAAENARDLRDRIVRDVRTAWLNANTAYQRVGVTAELAKEADLGLTLAQTRYSLGLSSIVELSQAQLQQTGAEIDNTNAQYQYRLDLAALNYQTGTAP